MTSLADKYQSLHEHMAKMNGHWIRLNGELYNCKTFWDEMFHNPEITNETWHDWLDVMDHIYLEEPGFFIPGARQIFDEARQYLNKHGHSENPRAMDRQPSKKREFKVLANMRDIWNAATGYQDPPKRKHTAETVVIKDQGVNRRCDIFNSLFDTN